MTTSDSIHVAWANMMANKMRSFLSVLGIVIGTGAVIVVISVVNGTRKATMDTMMAGMTDLLYLRPAYSENSGRFGQVTMDDVEHLRKVPFVRSASPEISSQYDVRGTMGQYKAMMIGVDEDYMDAQQIRLITGRTLNSEDTKNRHRVCLISNEIAAKIFGTDYPVGQRVRMENSSLEVVGVFAPPSYSMQLGMQTDILVPFMILLKATNTENFYSIRIRALPGKLDDAKREIMLMIGQRRGNEGLLELTDPREQIANLQKWGRAWMIQMALIAGISLLVGGIGLMNVMLTTVAERTHEIGLRKALGASSNMIQHQFLIEAAFLSGVGGFLGVFTGVSISYVLSVISEGKILISIMPASLAISFIFSVTLGIIFGLFPASKAAHLSPIEALRYD